MNPKHKRRAIGAMILLLALVGFSNWWPNNPEPVSRQSNAGVSNGATVNDPTNWSRTQTVGDAASGSSPNIAGVLRSGTGATLSGARVTLERELHEIGFVLTDNRGQFAFTAPPGNLTVRAEAAGFGVARVVTIAPTKDLAITLYPGNRIGGRVLFQGSLQPVANVHVEARSDVNVLAGRVADAESTTDAAGNFLFESLPSGMWSLTASGHGLWGERHDAIPVGIGEQVDDVVLTVEPANTVSGKFIVGASDAPCQSGQLLLVPEARVQRMMQSGTRTLDGKMTISDAVDDETRRFSGRTDANGEVGIDAVPYGAYRYSALCDGFQMSTGPTTVNVNSEQLSPATWTFVKAATLTVKVRDSNGAPVPAILVGIATLHSTLEEVIAAPLQRSATDADGISRFGGLWPGKYKIDAAFGATKGQKSTAKIFDLLPEMDAALVELNVQGAGSIRIHASKADGSSSSRMLFYASNAEGDRYDGVYRGDGWFEIGPMPRGNYFGYAYDNKNAKVPLNSGNSIAVGERSAPEIEFKYDAPVATLEGRVVDKMGAPIVGAFVRAVSATLDESDELFSTIQLRMQGGQELMTDDLGQFRITGLNARGTYDVYVDRLNGEQSIERNVTTGQFIQISLSPKPNKAE